ncbi:hypothetical protein ALC62_01128 [Cyphomyrmex costatus]|uniref:Uncharacterized protein n=1 Tax=Cyphomyrmex costatus TaxID=456900 RepID=A0A195D522_9HYME|nr:hypothetical protein ALC62_01128 [Cyphomyrmex costatus]
MRQLEIKAGSARKITGSPAVPSCSERGEAVESFRFVFLLVFSLYSDRSASLNIRTTQGISRISDIPYSVLKEHYHARFASRALVAHYRRQLHCLPVLFAETDKTEKKTEQRIMVEVIKKKNGRVAPAICVIFHIFCRTHR